LILRANPLFLIRGKVRLPLASATPLSSSQFQILRSARDFASGLPLRSRPQSGSSSTPTRFGQLRTKCRRDFPNPLLTGVRSPTFAKSAKMSDLFLCPSLRANNYRPTPARCFSSVSLFAEACANAADSAFPSACAMVRAATGFNHSSAMKAATMSQVIMT